MGLSVVKVGWATSYGIGPEYLSKEVETGLTATQFGSACAQTMPRLPGACLRQAGRGACPLFLPQKKLFSSFCRRIEFSVSATASFCRKIDVSAAEGTFLQFLPQN